MTTSDSTRPTSERSRRTRIGAPALACLALAVGAALAGAGPARAEEPAASSGGSMGEVGNKLANPLSNLWALSASINAPQFFDGDINTGDSKVGGVMVFQPVMPIPLFGEGDDQWRVITRPVIPIVFASPEPVGLDRFDYHSGLGDIQLPFLLAPSDNISGHFIIGGGPIFQFPTATNEALGAEQWAMGPAVVLGYKTKKATFGLFPNYFWKIASAGQDDDTPSVNKLSLLYFFNYALADAWQVGFNPTVTYNDRGTSGNKWNVPIGLYVGKTVKLGRLPVNIKVGGEYSVVAEELFGQRFQFRFQITPVIPSLIANPIFGG